MTLEIKQVVVQTYEGGNELHADHPFVVAAQYENADEHASGPFQVEFVLDGHTTHLLDVHDAGPGASDWVQWQVDSGAPAGAHHVLAKLLAHHHEVPHTHEMHWDFRIEDTPAPAAAQSGEDDVEVAVNYVRYEFAVLRHWHLALSDFDKTMTSSTEKETHPDFAGAMVKMFTEKVLGEIASAGHADLALDVINTLENAAKEAQAASTSVALRNFYHQHLSLIYDLDMKTTDMEQQLPDQVRARVATLLNEGKADEYAAFRAKMLALFHDAQARAHLTMEYFVDQLAVEWMKQSVQDPRYDVAMKIRIWEHDLSVIDFEVEGPDGDKLTEHLAEQRGGVDLWTLAVPRSFAVYEREGQFPACYVHVDAQNRYIDSPAEDSIGTEHTHPRPVYERLHSQGHLVVHS